MSVLNAYLLEVENSRADQVLTGVSIIVTKLLKICNQVKNFHPKTNNRV